MESVLGGQDGLRLRSATRGDQAGIVQLLTHFEEQARTPHVLTEQWQSLDLERQTRVVETAEEELVAYAELLQRRSGVFTPQIWVHPHYQRRGIGMKLLQALEACALSFSDESHCTMFSQPKGAGRAADRWLEKMGYLLHTTYEIRELSMHAAPEPALSIPGIEIRCFVPGIDEQRALEADNEAFLDQKGYTPRTLEEWSQRLNMHANHFDPALCFVAWDGETVAGGVYNQVLGGIGEVMHLGVRRPFRKRGVGTALMRHSLAEYYRRGITTIHLNVDGASLTRAHLLYEQMGFHVKDTYRNYAHELRG